MKTTILLTSAVLVLVAGTVSSAAAERNVIVNGMRLSPAQIQELEARACGPVFDGVYWLDTNTWIWGFAGNPAPQGRVGDACSGSAHGNPGQPATSNPYGHDDRNWYGFEAPGSAGSMEEGETDWSGFRVQQ